MEERDIEWPSRIAGSMWEMLSRKVSEKYSMDVPMARKFCLQAIPHPLHPHTNPRLLPHLNLRCQFQRNPAVPLASLLYPKVWSLLSLCHPARLLLLLHEYLCLSCYTPWADQGEGAPGNNNNHNNNEWNVTMWKRNYDLMAIFY